jgi:leader peptidase (prepilin peptidase)/N-methyltransferase
MTSLLLVTVGAALAAVAGWVTPASVARLPERALVSGAPTPRGRYADLDVAASRPVLAGVGALVAGLLAWARLAADAGLVEAAAFVVVGTLWVALAYVDLHLHKLPDLLTVPALVVGAALLGLDAAIHGDWGAYGRAWLAAGVLLAAYLLVAIAVPGALGLGDVKLAASVGLLLGWISVQTVVVGTVLAFLVGGVVAAAAMATGAADRRTALPFGPAIIAGAVLAVVAGEPIAAWYLAF